MDKADSNIQYWRDEFNNMRRFYDQKIAEKNSIIEQSFNNVEITTIQNNYNDNLIKTQSDYEKQISVLVDKLSNYNSSALDYDSLFKRYGFLENAYFDLQKAVFRSKETNESVDHLWQIKETEYNNIHEILHQTGNFPNRQPSNIINPINTNTNFNTTNINRPSGNFGETVTYTTNNYDSNSNRPSGNFGETVTYNTNNSIPVNNLNSSNNINR